MFSADLGEGFEFFEALQTLCNLREGVCFFEAQSKFPAQSQGEIDRRAVVSEKFATHIKAGMKIFAYREIKRRLHQKRIAVLIIRFGGKRISPIISKVSPSAVGVSEYIVAPGREQLKAGLRALIIQ